MMVVCRTAGQQVFWGLFDLYATVRLTTFAKQPSKWTHSGLDRWAKWLERSWPGPHVILSKHRNLSQGKMSSTPWYDRCLAQPSIDTVGLLFLLCVWAFLPKQRGGFIAVDQRQAASEIFAALVEAGCSRMPDFDFEVALVADWKCKWPRPSVEYDEALVFVKLAFRSPDTIDFSGLFDAGFEATETPQVYRQWVTAFLRGGFSANRSQCKVNQFMSALFADHALDSCVAQLLQALSKRVEASLGDQRDEPTPDARAALAFKSWAPSPKDRNMEEKLHRYVMSGARASARHRVFGMATDKASPAFMSLYNSSVVFPDGVMVLCCPQAALW